jgi:predicted nucleic acid-binding protein
VLVGPARSGDQRLIDLYSELISPRDGLLVAPVGRELWISAALERARSSMKLPDAVHVVTARAYGCEVLLTNDRGFSRASGLDVYFLDDPALC